MLVAGITHSGKSVALNSIISSFVFTHSPQTLRLMLFTPKNDFDKYKKLPHLPDRYDVIKENAILALEVTSRAIDEHLPKMLPNKTRS